jgi:hypothetical protein
MGGNREVKMSMSSFFLILETNFLKSSLPGQTELAPTSSRMAKGCSARSAGPRLGGE